MKILITGNMGYIGPCVEERLRQTHPGVELVGLDIGYFAHCLTNSKVLPETRISTQLFMDVRSVPASAFEGVDCVIHLAAISNDPMGNSFEAPTVAINAEATKAIAVAAKKAGVSHFVYASSCSMYGAGGDGARTEDATLNPLTAYARSKVASEETLGTMADDAFTVTSLRFSTACGMSERLRLDLVLNDFVAGAVVDKKITILSDGSPWRPLIHIRDMARAIDWASTRSADNGGNFVAVNVGSNAWNYQIKDLAEAVADVIGGIDVSINTDASPDKRSYQVNFDQFTRLAPDHLPQVTLERAVAELHAGLSEMNFAEANFRDTWYMRLKVLREHLDNGRLNADLRWR